MDKKIMSIWLKAQHLISQREGMIIFNKERESHGYAPGYDEAAFLANADQFVNLHKELAD
jgi:hypothetical protein